MIKNYKREPKPTENILFQLHGINYRIFWPDVDVFVQQDVMAAVNAAADEGGLFNPYVTQGIKATRILLTHLQVQEGEGYDNLSLEKQREFFGSDQTKDTLKEHLIYGEPCTPILHMGKLASLVQAMILDEGYTEEEVPDPLESAESENSQAQSSEPNGKDDSAGILNETAKRLQKS